MPKQDRPLTPEQLDIVRWTASLGAITAEALALRLGVSPPSARARLSAVQRRGLLSRKRPLVESPALFAATRTGLRASGVRGIKPGGISASSAHHLAVCAAAAAALERCYPDHRLVGEPELHRDERERGHPLACAVLSSVATGTRGSHHPDLVLWPHATNDLPVAVEVELTVKAPRRLVQICRGWARCRQVAGVLYLTTDPVQRALERAIEETRAGDRIVAVPLSALLPRGTAT